MKIAVYGLARDCESAVDRWINSAGPADHLIVIDAGSIDDTVESLRTNGVTVQSLSRDALRFDAARNAALDLVPDDTDACVSMDLDETLNEGWRGELERCWAAGASRVRHMSTEHASSDSCMISRIHARSGYRWFGSVHERIAIAGSETIVSSRNLVINKHAPAIDFKVSNFDLLQLDHAENPRCAETLFWLARECVMQNRNEEAAKHFKTYLDLPSSTWPAGRSEAMICLSRLMPHDQLRWLRMSAAEVPLRREPWVSLCEYHYHSCEWANLYACALQGLSIENRGYNHMDRADSWSAKLWDFAGLGAWNLGLTDRSLEYYIEANRIEPHNRRITDNYLSVKAAVQG
jgi:glycosyltransferase involved in cell wall biosynthesis